MLGRMGLEETLVWEFQEPGRGIFSPGNDLMVAGATLGLPPRDLVPPVGEGAD